MSRSATTSRARAGGEASSPGSVARLPASSVVVDGGVEAAGIILGGVDVDTVRSTARETAGKIHPHA